MKKLILGILILSANCVVAQQTEIYNQFFMNPYLYNAAYAGVEGHTVLYALYHNKWTNLEGAPEISHFSFHTPLKGGIGIGAAAFNDRYGPIGKNQGKISASYLLTIDREHHLRLGMSIGGGTQSLNFGALDDPTDPAFLDIISNQSFAVADFGATYHFGHFNVGFSIPNLIGYDIFQGESLSPIRVKPLDNTMFKINYRGHLSHDLAIEPHLIYRYSNLVPDQIEATVIFHIYHLVWAGASYRQNNTYAATFGAKIKEKFALGYAFELGNASISGLTGPSHEIHIGMHLGTKKEHAAHVSSFIKSHRLTPEQRAALAAKEREEKLQALQASRQTPQENSDALGIAGNSPADSDELSIAGNTEQETTAEEGAVETEWEIDETLPTATRTNPFGEKEKAIVIKQVNSKGDTVYAVAWEPVDEDWELVNEPPINRSSSDGTTELGVKYYRTKPNGEKELIIKWEPVVSQSQMNDLLESSSTEEVLAQNNPPASNNEDNLVITDEVPITTANPIDDSGSTDNSLVVDESNVTSSDTPQEIPRTIADSSNNASSQSLTNTESSDAVVSEEDVTTSTPNVADNTPVENPTEVSNQEAELSSTDSNSPVQETQESQIAQSDTPDPNAIEPTLTSPTEVSNQADLTLNEPEVAESGNLYPTTTNEVTNTEIRNQERERGDDTLTEDFRTNDELAESDEPLAVTRGNHPLELPAGYYLIGGAFEEFQHAEDYSDELFPKGYHEVIVGYSSARGYYYTVISRHSNLSEANAEKARIRGRQGMSDVWVLNVEN